MSAGINNMVMTIKHPALGSFWFRWIASAGGEDTLVLVDPSGDQLGEVRPLAPGECVAPLQAGQPDCVVDAVACWELSIRQRGGMPGESRVLFRPLGSDETRELAGPGLAAWAVSSLMATIGCGEPGQG